MVIFLIIVYVILVPILAGILHGMLLRSHSIGGYTGGKRPEGDIAIPKGGSGNSRFHKCVK